MVGVLHGRRLYGWPHDTAIFVELFPAPPQAIAYGASMANPLRKKGFFSWGTAMALSTVYVGCRWSFVGIYRLWRLPRTTSTVELCHHLSTRDYMIAGEVFRHHVELALLFWGSSSLAEAFSAGAHSDYWLGLCWLVTVWLDQWPPSSVSPVRPLLALGWNQPRREG